MKLEKIQALIDDVLQAPKYPDGTLREEEEIIQEYKDNWEEEFEAENITSGILLDDKTLKKMNLFAGDDIIGKYIGKGKIRIKIRKGAMLIERA